MATAALFVLLAAFAWKSGRRVYETGPALDIAREGETVILRWSAAIDAPMARRFEDAFEVHKDNAKRFLIDLNSPGGSIVEGRLVIAAIEDISRNRTVDTYVGADAYCLSMCVPIFLKGEARAAAPSAKFMFHEPTTRDLFTDEEVDKPGFEKRLTSARFFERYFESAPLDPDWRRALQQSWGGRDLWFTAQQLVDQNSGVVTELAE